MSDTIQLIVPNISSGYFLRPSEDEAVQAVSQCDAARVKSFLKKIPVYGRLFIEGLQNLVGTPEDGLLRRNLFVILPHFPTRRGTGKKKYEFCYALATLIRRSKGPDIVVVQGDFNVQVEVNALETCLGGHCVLPAQFTDDGIRPLQRCGDNLLFLSSMNSRHSLHLTAT